MLAAAAGAPRRIPGCPRQPPGCRTVAATRVPISAVAAGLDGPPRGLRRPRRRRGLAGPGRVRRSRSTGRPEGSRPAHTQVRRPTSHQKKKKNLSESYPVHSHLVPECGGGRAQSPSRGRTDTRRTGRNPGQHHHRRLFSLRESKTPPIESGPSGPSTCDTQ